MDTDFLGSADCQGLQGTSEDAVLKTCAVEAAAEPAPEAASSLPAAGAEAAEPHDDALEQEFLTIEQGLQEYCENPTATAFMRIYTCIYNLCNERKRKHLVCKAVYDKYLAETSVCTDQLRDSMSLFSAALGDSQRRSSFSTVLNTWCHLQRRLHALQASFGYLDRYYVPRSHLASLSDVRLALLQKAGLEEQALVMWSSVALGIRSGVVRIGCHGLQELVTAWVSLLRVAGLENDAMLTCVAGALREHFVVMLSSGKPGGTAVDRVLRTQPPLVQCIVEYLSEPDLFEVYSNEPLQRSK